ncbi:MAG: hypothetical protein O7B99_04440, partial [Planctomycetota bacterium]|nr:hypothetical protein [Planctomycetota bacterium]
MGESPRARRRGQGPLPGRTLAILCVALAVLTWAGSLFRSGFSYDDREAIFDNPVVNGSAALTEAFRRDYWHHLGDAGHYRPLATVTLRLDHALHGESAVGYHLTNVALHAAVVALGAFCLLRLGGGRAAPLLGLAVFAMHPALADSVAWISGRTSMVSALGGTFALAAAIRFVERPAVLGVLVGLGIFVGLGGKEDAVIFALP